MQLTAAAEAEAAMKERSTGYAAELQRLDLFAKAGATRAGVFAPPCLPVLFFGLAPRKFLRDKLLYFCTPPFNCCF